MIGHSDDEIGDNVDEFLSRIHPDDKEHFQRELEAHLLGQSSHFEFECRIAHADGTWRWVLLRAIAVRNEAGEATRMAGSQTDITDRRVAQERLEHDALHDALTGLPNRVLLMDRITRSLNRAKRHPEYRFALIFLDLDRFKNINDGLGHVTGDQVLRIMATRLLTCLRPGDTVARFAGDEFAMVLEDVQDDESVTAVANRVQKTLGDPIMIDDHEITSTVSMGIAMSSPSYVNSEDLLRDADNALYRAKAAGSDRYVVFDASMHAHVLESLALEADLRRAIERNQLQAYFQPILRLGSSKVQGFEALARWLHPERGMIPPELFIPIAEETGLISAVGEWMLRKSCETLMEWKAAGLPNCDDLRINVNLSPRQFGRGINLAERIASIVSKCGVSPSQFGLEITENTLLHDSQEAKRAMERMKECGFTLYLDDFGKGYSSLGYLHNFPFDVVKIDRSFIFKMQQGGSEHDIVQAILVLAGNLRMGVVAEGVETADQLHIVRSLGCDCAQGYFIAPPMPAKDARALLIEDRSW
jgi:diguanylate cyclase (GGDEF)-like protein/PAS domain S-box-containing protein